MNKHITKRELDWYTDVDGNIVMRIFQTYEDNKFPIEAFHGIFKPQNNRYELQMTNEALNDCMNLHVNKNSKNMEISENVLTFKTSLTEDSGSWISFGLEYDPEMDINIVIANDHQYVIDALKTFKSMVDFEKEV